MQSQGASFALTANATWLAGFNTSNGCNGSPIGPAYTANGSGNGLGAMGAGTGNANQVCTVCVKVPSTPIGQRSDVTRLAGTDEPPSTIQVDNINAGTASTTDNGRIRLIPAALGANVAVVHIPDACSLDTVADTLLTGPTNVNVNSPAATGDTDADNTQRPLIGNDLIEAAFAGDPSADTWVELIPGITPNDATCATHPVMRVVRQDISGTTYGWKAYLNLVFPGRDWDSAALNTDNRFWPVPGGGAPAQPNAVANNACTVANSPNRLCSATASGNGNLTAVVRDSQGTIGYSDVATARTRNLEITPNPGEAAQDKTMWLSLQNIAETAYFEGTTDPAAHKPSVGAKGSNCLNTAVVNVPTAASSPDNDPTFGDWSQAFAAGGAGYPSCVLTYLLAWDDNAAVYGNTGAEEAKARTVKDYASYIVSSFGQNFFNVDYSPLSAGLLAIAQNGVNAIGWNKTAGSGGGGGGGGGGTGGGGGGTTTPPPAADTTVPPPAIITPPSNVFSIPTAKVAASSLVFTLQVPGAGALVAKSTTRAGGKTIKVGAAAVNTTGAGVVKATIKFSSAFKKALAKVKSKRLTVKTTFTFTPTGGTASAPQTKSNTVKRPKKKQ